MNTDKNGVVSLNDDELDMVVGGVLNQSMVEQLNLKVLIGKSGTQGLIGKYSISNITDKGFSGSSRQGPMSEQSLEKLLQNPNFTSMQAQANNGTWVTLNRQQLEQLVK